MQDRRYAAMERSVKNITMVLTTIVLMLLFYLVSKGYIFIIEWIAKIIIGVIK